MQISSPGRKSQGPFDGYKRPVVVVSPRSPATVEQASSSRQAIFHEGSKGYLCCKRRVLEFSEFLKIEGCTEGKHLFVGPKKDEVSHRLSSHSGSLMLIPSRHEKSSFNVG